MKRQQSTTSMILVPTILAVSLIFSQFCFAGGSNPSSSPGDDFQTAQKFFTVTDGSRHHRADISPVNWFQDQALPALQEASTDLALMNWTEHNTPPTLPTEPYNRKKQFGTWIVDSTLGGCYNTRARALIRDSQVPVSFKDTNKCVVDGGKWLDPYTGQIFTSSQDIQIDHVVPLKHAYLSGAWSWSQKKRCMYTNFLSDSYHLRSVSGHENMKKGDSSPSGYLPPDSKDVCSYVTDWLKIKVAWNLIMAPSEATAIEQVVNSYHCQIPDMRMSLDELKTLRLKILALETSCKSPEKDNGNGDDPHNVYRN